MLPHAGLPEGGGGANLGDLQVLRIHQRGDQVLLLGLVDLQQKKRVRPRVLDR